MKFNKLSASALLVEILLVSLAVSLGALLFGWSNSFVQSSRSSADEANAKLITCKNNVDFNVWIRDRVSMVCYNSTLKIVQVYLENKGRYISKFNVKITNSSLESSITQIDASIDTGETKRYLINYSSMNDFIEISIVPVIIEKDQAYRICSDTYIVLNKARLSPCENIIYFR
ncbi:MAG: hypothetical protein QXS41_01470 [Candidatus Woesearchaeota archaeon]